MGVLCFVLDLRSLAPALLREVKQSLLQLANYYAIYNPYNNSSRTQSEALPDRIGLCYILTNRMSCSTELKVAYTPRVNFNLRDFHRAVNHLPTDAFIPEFNISGGLSFADIKISSVLSDEVLYSWGKHDKGVSRKLFLISSCIVRILDWDTKRILMDAADKCVSVEFTYIEYNMNHLGDSSVNINNFVKQIGDLENCSFRSYLSDPHVLTGMAKQWFQELKDDMEELLPTRLSFKYNLISNVNQLSCNLYRCFYQILDGFVSCKTCRCHGIPMDEGNADKNKNSCPVTGRFLGELDLIENSLKIGESTILLMPSFQCCQKLEQVSFPIDFTVVERTPIGSLSEGSIFGPSYLVAASNYDEYDDTDKWERNSQVFQVVCELLSSLDQGLICSSYCNVQTMKETTFLCYYVLLPSDKGMMLLRKKFFLCGNQFTCSTMAKEMESAVHSSLLKMQARTYNPLQHERGFHQKLNLLVKESLQFGAIPPVRQIHGMSSSNQQDSEEVSGPPPEAALSVAEDEIPHSNDDTGNKSSSCIAEEWEQLMIIDPPDMHSPEPVSKPKLDYPVSSQLQSNRQVDERTSKILERLEVPRELKKKTVSPKTPGIASAESCMSTKKPLIPYGPTHPNDQGTKASQPMKPNFSKLKRKR